MTPVYQCSDIIKEHADFKSMSPMMLAMWKMHGYGRKFAEVFLVGGLMVNL